MVAAGHKCVVTEQALLATLEALRLFRCSLLSGQQLTLVTANSQTHGGGGGHIRDTLIDIGNTLE